MADKVDDILIDIEADISDADEGLDKLTNSLTRLANAVKNVDADKFSRLKTEINSFKVDDGTVQAIGTFASAINGLSRVANTLSLQRPTAEAEVFANKAKEYAKGVADAFGVSKKDIGELEEKFLDLAESANKGVAENGNVEGIASSFTTLVHYIWATKNVVNDFGKQYESVVNKIRSLSKGRVKFDFGIDDVGDDAIRLQKIIGKGFTFKNDPNQNQMGFDAWLKDLDPSEISMLNSVIKSQGGIVGDTASAFKALAKMVEDYNTATRKGAVAETEFNSSIQNVKDAVADAFMGFDGLSQQVGKVDFSHVTNNSKAFHEIFAKVVENLNGIKIDSSVGVNLEAMAKGFKSITTSIKNIQDIDSTKLQEIADVISKVGVSLGNLGSNNKINIKIDSEGIKATSKALEKVKKDTEETAKGEKNLTSEAKNATNSAKTFGAALDGVGEKSQKSNNRLQLLADEIRHIKSELSGFQKGKISLDDSQVVSYTKRLKQLSDEYKKLTEMMGKAPLLGQAKAPMTFDSEAFNKMSKALGKVSQGAKVASTFFQSMYNHYAKLLKIVTMPVKLLGGRIIQDTKNIGKAFTNMSTKVQASLKKMTAFWQRAMKTFSFMLVRKAITAVLQELETAKQSLALWSDYVGTKFNDSVSNIKADCNWIARSIVAAFEPLINAVAPIIDYLAEKISNFLAKVGEFFAALTGQSYYVKAKKNVVDYAKSLDKAKKTAKNGLQSFDEINNITTQKNSDADSPLNTFKDDWEKHDVTDKMKDFAEKVKNIAKDLWYPIGKAWDAMKDYVIGGWKYMTGEIKSLAKDMWADFIDVWKQDATVDIFKNIFGIVGDIEYTVGNLVHNFHEAWSDSKVGKKILENIRDIFGIIVQHVRNVTLYMKEWSKSIDFHPLLASVEKLTDSFKRVADFIGGEFEDVMKLGVLKFTKWFIEQGLPGINNAFANVFDAFDFDKIRKDIKPVISAIEKLIENLVGGATDAFEYLGKRVADFFNSADFSKMSKNLSKIFGVFTRDRIATVLEAIGKAFLDIAEALGKIVLSDATVELFKQIGNLIDMKGVDGLANDIKSLVKNLALFGGLTGVALVVSKITAAFSGLFGVLGNLAQWKEMSDIAKSMKEMANAGEAVKNVKTFGEALDGIKNFGTADVGTLAESFKSMGAAKGFAATVGTIGTNIAAGIAAAIAGYQGGKWGAYALEKAFGNDATAEVYKNFDITKDLASWMDVDQSPLENAKDALSGLVLMIKELPDDPAMKMLGSIFLPVGNGIALLVDNAKATFENVKNVVNDAAVAYKIFGEDVGSSLQVAGANISAFIEDAKGAFDLWGEDIGAWWVEHIDPWFTVEKWMELGEGMKQGLKAKWDETAGQWVTDITTWWETNVAPWFAKEKWTEMLSGIKPAFSDAFKGAVNAAIECLNKLLEGIEKMLNEALGADGLGKIGEFASKVGIDIPLDFSGIKIPKIPTFANGGFPEDGIFAANHNELVGQFDNGRTAVANNSQIVEGIASGVNQANQEQYSLLNQMIDLLGVIADKDLTIGDDAIFNSYRRGEARYVKRYGV